MDLDSMFQGHLFTYIHKISAILRYNGPGYDVIPI
jgi:hypothetical protein